MRCVNLQGTRNELVQEKYKDQKRITFPSGEKIPYFFLRTVRKL